MQSGPTHADESAFVLIAEEDCIQDVLVNYALRNTTVHNSDWTL